MTILRWTGMLRHNRKGLWKSGLIFLGSAAAVAAMNPNVRKAAKRAAIYTKNGFLTVSDTATNTANNVASRVKNEGEQMTQNMRRFSSQAKRSANTVRFGTQTLANNTANRIRRTSTKALKIRKRLMDDMTDSND